MKSNVKKLGIGLLGFGTVGSGVFKWLNIQKSIWKEKFGIGIEIIAISVNNPSKHPQIDDLLVSPEILIEHSEVNLVIEAIGGLEPAKWLRKALCTGKHVITANKWLVATFLEELEDIARINNVCFYFSSSVGGSVPILEFLSKQIHIQKITKVSGILNGTSNFVLSSMEGGLSFEESVKFAQEQGLAEQDPSQDLNGNDIMNKLLIISKSVFKIQPVSIDIVELNMFLENHQENIPNSRLKYIGLLDLIENKISVIPQYLESNNPLFYVSNENVGILIEGQTSGQLMLQGPGAGSNPTSNSVLQDVVKIIEWEKVK